MFISYSTSQIQNVGQVLGTQCNPSQILGPCLLYIPSLYICFPIPLWNTPWLLLLFQTYSTSKICFESGYMPWLLMPSQLLSELWFAASNATLCLMSRPPLLLPFFTLLQFSSLYQSVLRYLLAIPNGSTITNSILWENGLVLSLPYPFYWGQYLAQRSNTVNMLKIVDLIIADILCWKQNLQCWRR